MKTRLVFLSDTHLSHSKDYFPNETFPSVPDGDILIHCGDGTFRGTQAEMYTWLKWFKSFPHKEKCLVAGNHELGMERSHSVRQWALQYMRENFITYLEDSGITINGLKFYGSPHTPLFYDWSFMHEGESIKKYWDAIPLDTDVLITHGPPYGILDKVKRLPREGKPDEVGKYLTSVGCPYLLNRVGEVMPTIHAFGHLHANHGILYMYNTLFINAAIVNDEYKVAYNPIVVDIDENKLTTLVIN